MQKLKKVFLLQLILLSIFTYTAIAQSKVQITGTNLKIILKEGFTLDENSATISNQAYGISFLEMAGVNFYEQIDDFKDIEEEYAQKGIVVKQNKRGKIGSYEAQLITLESNPAIYQVVFGNSDFFAMANVIAADTLITINEMEINAMLSSIEYQDSKESALEEHANFVINDENKEWNFVSYTANTFLFENNNSDDVLMIMQLPPEALFFDSPKNLTKEFVNKFKEKMPNLEVIEESDWEVNNLKGYRVLLNTIKDGNENLELIYMFVFGNEKSSFVIQGLGEKNDLSTKKLFDKLLNQLKLKK